MKLIKNASGKTILKLSKQEWQKIGKQAGFGSSWKNAPGSIHIETVRQDNGVWEDASSTAPLPASVQQELNNMRGSLDDGPAEISINFTSSGYYEPATMYNSYGDPGDPAEGDDERIIQSIEIAGIPLSPKSPTFNIVASDLEEMYREDMLEAEINTEHNEPD
tara:strand:- start:927 stop:1415 length:489 start_codon:yes stop_codon:yes gene_type:complete